MQLTPQVLQFLMSGGLGGMQMPRDPGMSMPPQMDPGMGGGAAPQIPVPIAAAPRHGFRGFLDRVNGGATNALNKVGAGLFPANPAMTEGMDPQQIQQMQRSGLMNMGLGMMASRGNFNQAFAQGVGGAQQQFQGGLGQAFQVMEKKKQDARQAAIDARETAQQDWERAHTEKLDTRQDKRDEVSDQHFDATMAASSADRTTQRAIQREQIQAQKDIAEANRANAYGIAGLKAGAGGQKPTEYDKKASLLYGEMHDAAKQMDTLDKSSSTNTSSLGNRALGALPITRIFTSDDYRKYEAAGERWAQNFLYLKSGAQAPEQEVQRTMKQYLPQPGDGPQVQSQKATARQQAMQNVSHILNPNVGGGNPQDPLGIR